MSHPIFSSSFHSQPKIIWIDPTQQTHSLLTLQKQQHMYHFIQYLTIVSTICQAIKQCLTYGIQTSSISSPSKKIYLISNYNYLNNILQMINKMQVISKYCIIYCQTKQIAQILKNQYKIQSLFFLWNLVQFDNCFQLIFNIQNNFINSHHVYFNSGFKSQSFDHFNCCFNCNHNQNCQYQQSLPNSTSPQFHPKASCSTRAQLSQLQPKIYCQSPKKLTYFTQILWINQNPNYVHQQTILSTHYQNQFIIFNSCKQAIIYYRQNQSYKNLLILCSSSLIQLFFNYVPNHCQKNFNHKHYCLIFCQNDDKSKSIRSKYQNTIQSYWSVQEIISTITNLENQLGNPKEYQQQDIPQIKNNNSIIIQQRNQINPQRPITEQINYPSQKITNHHKNSQLSKPPKYLIWLIQTIQQYNNLPFQFLQYLFYEQGIQIKIKSKSQYINYQLCCQAKIQKVDNLILVFITTSKTTNIDIRQLEMFGVDIKAVSCVRLIMGENQNQRYGRGRYNYQTTQSYYKFPYSETVVHNNEELFVTVMCQLQL